MLTVTLTFTTITCFQCGEVFAMNDEAYQVRVKRKEKANWYCPQGHSQHFIGKTDADIQRERADRLERMLANRDEDLRSERASHTATKGHLTRVRKRADRGVCLHCHRSFVNVERHVASQHPDVLAAVT